MYAWVYLNELLTTRDFLGVASVESYDVPKEAETIRARFKALREAVVDPQHQISDDLIERFIPATMFLFIAGAQNAEFCELGPTFFASIEKLDLCGQIIGSQLSRKELQFSGIEYSPFLRRASLQFHPNDQIQLVETTAQWRRSRPYAFHMSRFVGSYAFRATQDMIAEVNRYDAFHVTDVFNLAGSDFHSWDLGLPITFMNLPALVDGLSDAGFDLYITGADPEFHAAGRQKAAVIRLFGIRKEVDCHFRYFEHFDRMGGFTSLTASRRIFRGDGLGLLSEIDSRLTSEEWDAFAEYKKYFPIWGPSQSFTKKQIAELVSNNFEVDLLFDTGQAVAVARRALANHEWRPASPSAGDEQG
jgi:hypothetical protein